jgi:hypothetical protein
MSVTIKDKQKDTDQGKFTLNLTKEEENKCHWDFMSQARFPLKLKKNARYSEGLQQAELGLL